MELSGAYWRTCALHAAVKLDVFTCLGEKGKTALEAAKTLHTDTDGTTRLLNALAAMGLIQHIGDYYSNTNVSHTFLSKASDQYIGHMIMHHHHLVESWSRLDEAVTSGQPISEEKLIDENTRRKHFLMGMYNNASLMAPNLVKAVDLSSRKKLLDLGGGPGTYAIHFCKTNPQLVATVYDLPTTRPFAEKTIERYKLAERIRFVGGDYSADEIPGQYDVVWMSHIIHSEGRTMIERLLQKVMDALTPEGQVFIHDFFLEDRHSGPLFPALFSLNMLVRTQEGRSYSEKEIKAMLEKAGFNQIIRHEFKGPTESGIISAVR